MANSLMNRLAYPGIRRVVRGLHSSSIIRKAAYEGDGQTTVTILNKDLSLGLMIDAYTQIGFRLNNKMTILGPMVIFPRSVLSWNISTAEEINEQSLSLFTVLEPKLDIIVVGYGDADKQQNKAFSKSVLAFMRRHNITVEMLPTEQACATFNFLNSEGRFVGAALIPPRLIRANEDDIMQSRIRQQALIDKSPGIF